MSFAVARYQSASVETASPSRIVVQLYDGAIRFLNEAVAALEQGQIARKGVAVGRAFSIVGELQATLDHEAAPELCSELDRLYEFVLHSITQGNMRNDAEALRAAARVLGTLREAWAQVAAEQK